MTEYYPRAEDLELLKVLTRDLKLGNESTLQIKRHGMNWQGFFSYALKILSAAAGCCWQEIDIFDAVLYANFTPEVIRSQMLMIRA